MCTNLDLRKCARVGEWVRVVRGLVLGLFGRQATFSPICGISISAVQTLFRHFLDI